MGREVTSQLEHANVRFVIVDKSHEMVGEVIDDGSLVIFEDAPKDNTLFEAGIEGEQGLRGER